MGFILSAIVFLICLVIMISVLTSIDIKNGIVIMPDLDPSKANSQSSALKSFRPLT
ncbi:MAG: hypothetical protein ACLRWH_03170 [Emergencia sp.]